MAFPFTKESTGRHVVLVILVALLLLISFLLDRAYSSRSELLDIIYVVPIITGAFFLNPLEILTIGVAAVLLELGTETAVFQKDPAELLTAVGVGVLGVTVALGSRYVRRFLNDMRTARDEPQILNIAVKVLRLAGYQVLSASNPSEALRLAKEHQGTIHLLISDVIMPEMNGKSLRDKMVILRPGIKVLFMSGYTADIIAHRGVLEAGVMFLQKPFSVDALAARVREALD